ncbi:MAG: hypothetical protein U0939_11620 [Pirellulales bacterium]
MKRLFQLAICVAVAAGTSASWAWESPETAKARVQFPLSLKIIDPDSEKQLPPYIVMFPKGLDDKGADVRGPLGRFEALRGPSKLFPESNDDPGLPVVLRGLRLHRKTKSDGATSGYMLELQGEHNMIMGSVKTAEVDKFLAGEPAAFAMKGELNVGLYSYTSNLRLQTQLRGQELYVLGVDGAFTFREGFRRFNSTTTRLTPPPGRDYLYRGVIGELPELPEL